jgi:hypothetical protein
MANQIVSFSLEDEIIAAGVLQRSAPAVLEKLKDVAAGHVAAIDAGRSLLQVLSQQSATALEDLDGYGQAHDAVQAAIIWNHLKEGACYDQT